MKLGRSCAAAALLGTVMLPLTGAVGWAEEPAAAEQSTTQQPAPEPTVEPTEVREDRNAPSARPVPAPEERLSQVSKRPVGAPETGGTPDESGIDAAALGGAAAAVALASGGTLLVLRRRRAGTN